MDILPLLADSEVLDFLRASGDIVIVPDEPIITADDLLFYLDTYPTSIILTDVRQSLVEGGMYLPRLIRREHKKNPIVGVVDLNKESLPFGVLKTDYLTQGGDDMLDMPLDPKLTRAVLSAVSRRNTGRTDDIFVTRIDGYRVVLHSNIASMTINGIPIRLTIKEYAMAQCLATRSGCLMSKQQLLDGIYGPLEDVPEMKIIDVFICKLRKKIAAEVGKTISERLIETVWGRGYRWFKEPEKSP